MASYLEPAIEIAREAGALLSRYFERRVGYELKGVNDLVTEADRASESLVIDRLKSKFPSHSVVGEETGLHDGSSEYRWYVDPLDGTTNFAHGFPVYNVTLALAKDDEVIAGVILDPTRDELFSVEKGGGAFLNQHRIHVSKAAALKESLTATGFPGRRPTPNFNLHFMHQVAMQTQGVRRPGAAALDLAYVACGRIDAFWEFGLNPWDMAAGTLLVAEAGGKVTDMHGQTFRLKGEHVLADNALIHDEIIGLFGEVFRGEMRVPLP